MDTHLLDWLLWWIEYTDGLFWVVSQLLFYMYEYIMKVSLPIGLMWLISSAVIFFLYRVHPGYLERPVVPNVQSVSMVYKTSQTEKKGGVFVIK